NINVSQHTAFTIPIDAVKDVTTGISAYDRSKTIYQAISDESKPEDFIKPGHVFPLIARKGGVLVRAGHTEGSVDIARIAGLKPASVICEIMKDDGDMARLEDLKSIAKKHNIKIATIADLISYRLGKEKFVNRVAEAELPTEFGTFKSIVYESEINPVHHVALVKGEIDPAKEILVRVHSESLISDVFNTKNCDSRAKLIKSMEIIEDEGSGVILYIRSESHGKGLVNKIKEYSIKGKISDPMDGNDDLQYKSELRNYGVGAQILRDLNVRKIRLLSNNNKKVKGLEGFGLKIVEKVQLNISDDLPNFVKLKSIS
ncbi:MAG: GTP cyclohydrolase II RibA, partial [Thermodesulfobacteriota bacterium]